jgi:hypothetical protein
MFTIPSRRHPCLSGLFRSCFLLGVALFLSAVATTRHAAAEDWLHGDHEVAKTWAMHKIAVIQAESGDVRGAKQTVLEIGAPLNVVPVDVTSVWFVDGQPVYNQPPARVVPPRRQPCISTPSCNSCCPTERCVTTPSPRSCPVICASPCRPCGECDGPKTR